MINSKTNARITGILFILGTVPIIIAMVLWGQPLSSPDYLSSIAANSDQMLLFALAIMFMGLACAGIGISLYPVLKRHNEGMALAAMGFRLMEGTLQVASAVGFVALVALSQEFVKAGSPSGSFFQTAGAVIRVASDWLSNVGYIVPFCVGAGIYYMMFYRTRLVPRWLSVWGLLGLALMLVSAFAGTFGFLSSASPILFFLNMPILFQELVLAVWLIAKGYAPSSVVPNEAQGRRVRHELA